jgi:hypothetical protein
VQTESPIGKRRVFLAVPLDRHAAHEHEAAPAVERVEPLLRRLRQGSERKIIAGQLSERLPGRPRVRERAIEILDLRAGEHMNPIGTRRHLGSDPGGIALHRLHLDARHADLAARRSIAAVRRFGGTSALQSCCRRSNRRR